MRVVFDSSEEFEGRSINEERLSGLEPHLTNQITVVLTCFRQEPVAFMADVEPMYYQVIVPDNQQVFLKFSWWNNGNLLEQPQDFIICVHIFGGTSYVICSTMLLGELL